MPSWSQLTITLILSPPCDIVSYPHTCSTGCYEPRLINECHDIDGEQSVRTHPANLMMKITILFPIIFYLDQISLRDWRLYETPALVARILRHCCIPLDIIIGDIYDDRHPRQSTSTKSFLSLLNVPTSTSCLGNISLPWSDTRLLPWARTE